MNADNIIQFRRLTLAHREALLQMYRRFHPLGLAHGLPPRNEEARQIWIDRALQREVNMGAFAPTGDLLGHSFLAPSGTDEAEMAVFVHQGCRQRGIGRALVKAVLHLAELKSVRRIWVRTASENVPAVRLLKSCGFRLSRYVSPDIELDLDVSAAVRSGASTGRETAIIR